MTAKIKFSNAASCQFAGPVGATDLSIAVAAGKGALFPTDNFKIVMRKADGTYEVAFVSSRTGDALTIPNLSSRGIEGTTPLSFLAADYVSAPVTAEQLNDFLQASKDNTVTGSISMSGGVINEGQGADIASASTINLETATGNLVDVTGNTDISAITLGQGHERTVRFTGGATLKNGAGLILLTGADIVTQAGDFATFRGYAAGVVRMTGYTRSSGAPIGSAGSFGQCQLQYVDSTHIKLVPKDGNLLTVNGVACTVPDAGVTYAASGLSANTLYYVYATQSGGAINALELSTTGHSPSTTAGNKGTEIKTGDNTRSLVGMVYQGGVANQFSDDNINRLVRSWFNDTGVAGVTILGANSTMPSGGGYAELNSGYRGYVLLWAYEALRMEATISAQEGSSVTNAAGVICAIDGSTFGVQGYAANYPTLATNIKAHGISGNFSSDGMHYLSIFAYCSTGYYQYAMAAYSGLSYMTMRRR